MPDGRRKRLQKAVGKKAGPRRILERVKMYPLREFLEDRKMTFRVAVIQAEEVHLVPPPQLPGEVKGTVIGSPVQGIRDIGIDDEQSHRLQFPLSIISIFDLSE